MERGESLGLYGSGIEGAGIFLKVGFYEENRYTERRYEGMNPLMNPLILFTDVSEEAVSFNGLGETDGEPNLPSQLLG